MDNLMMRSGTQKEIERKLYYNTFVHFKLILTTNNYVLCAHTKGERASLDKNCSRFFLYSLKSFIHKINVGHLAIFGYLIDSLKNLYFSFLNKISLDDSVDFLSSRCSEREREKYACFNQSLIFIMIDC